MKTRFFFGLLLCIVLCCVLVNPVQADGIIIPYPCDGRDCPPEPLPISQLSIRYHDVTVTIQDQIAVTRVDQVFYNPNSWTVEGTYVFPLPEGAAVTDFTLWVDGQPVQGQVLDANQARQVYQESVQNMQDPALLEYIGHGAVQASVTPILPYTERQIELEYTQALTSENGLVEYVYPLNTERFSVTPLESVQVKVNIIDGDPIQLVYSPSHPIDVVQLSLYENVATYTDSFVTPDTDFALYYSVGEQEAFHLLTYRDPSDTNDQDGYFMMLVAPQPDVNVQVIPKDVILVLDCSGSMEGEKFQQARQAAQYILEQLNPNDRFSLITFNTYVYQYAYEPTSAEQNLQAISWLNTLSATGSTDINQALLMAASMVDPERPTYLLFMTDGLPTTGVTDIQQILENFSRSSSDSLRLYPFGVGYDVDTYLLDSLSEQHHGLSTYVSPEDDLQEKLSTFYNTIRAPVLTNLSLQVNGVAVYDVYPSPLPDLFIGSQEVIVGRYNGSGVADITLSGYVGNQYQEFHYTEQMFTQDSREDAGTLTTIPRLWATRKVGYLLNQIRLHGSSDELIDQVVNLSIRFGIVTPYTSYLVTEPQYEENASAGRDSSGSGWDWFGLGGAASIPPAAEAAPDYGTTGAQAVQAAATQNNMANAETANEVAVEASDQVQVAGSRTFVLNNGVWTDTTFDPDSMDIVTVELYSDAYFDLAAQRQDVAAAFALSEQVIVVIDGTAYQVVTGNAELSEAVDVLDNTGSTGTGETDDVLPAIPCIGGLLPIGLVILSLRWRR
jgi:Ca-activated chloride channel family protein